MLFDELYFLSNFKNETSTTIIAIIERMLQSDPNKRKLGTARIASPNNRFTTRIIIGMLLSSKKFPN